MENEKECRLCLFTDRKQIRKEMLEEILQDVYDRFEEKWSEAKYYKFADIVDWRIKLKYIIEEVKNDNS